MGKRLIYVHDPMCSWCWAFRPVWKAVVAKLPADIEIQRLLGGLAPDSDDPMPDSMRHFVLKNWHAIEQKVPGTEFNYDFWEKCNPRRSTWPACRGVIAAKEQGVEFEEPMVDGIQQAYYLQARNPSDNDTLTAVAEEIGLDAERFYQTLIAPETQQQLEAEMIQGRSMGLDSFPSLALVTDKGYKQLSYNYLDPQQILEQL